MKNLTTCILSFSFLLLVFFSSCKKGDTGNEGPQGAQGAAGPTLSGNLAGYVLLFDQYGSKQLTHLDSVMVMIVGTTRMAYTDSTGKYEFTGLTTGSYTLTFDKSGYGSDQATQQFTGGGTFYRADVRMSAIPNYNLLSVRDSLTSTDAFLIDSVSPDTKPRSLIIFVGVSPAISGASPASYLNFYTKNFNANAIRPTVDIPFTDLYNLGFISGETVYIAAYGICTNFSNSSSFEDFSTGRDIFTAISPIGATSSFVLP